VPSSPSIRGISDEDIVPNERRDEATSQLKLSHGLLLGEPSMTTITANTTLGIDLNPAIYTSPVVIGAGVTISSSNFRYIVYRHTAPSPTPALAPSASTWHPADRSPTRRPRPSPA